MTAGGALVLPAGLAAKGSVTETLIDFAGALALVRAVNQLTLENQQLRDAHPGGSVIPFPDRVSARPPD